MLRDCKYSDKNFEILLCSNTHASVCALDDDDDDDASCDKLQCDEKVQCSFNSIRVI